jgi:hypothetical protein
MGWKRGWLYGFLYWVTQMTLHSVWPLTEPWVNGANNISLHCYSSSSGAQCVTLEIKIGCGKVKTDQFWLSKMVLALHFGWGRAHTNTWQRRECNECDHNGAPWFWFANHNDWSRWVAISGLPPICTPSFSFKGGVRKK